jgi:hypothetical protein
MDQLKLPSLVSAMGSFPLEDMAGMKMVIAVLDWSLDPGLYAELVQWETFRRTRSAVTNISQAGVFLGSSVGAYKRKKIEKIQKAGLDTVRIFAHVNMRPSLLLRVCNIRHGQYIIILFPDPSGSLDSTYISCSLCFISLLFMFHFSVIHLTCTTPSCIVVHPHTVWFNHRYLRRL